MWITKQLTVATDLVPPPPPRPRPRHTLEIHKNIFYCTQRKKETHAGLEQYEGE